jgi:DNA-directed RNA polymerase sigma subunit (sigma70/sigma32)
MTTRRDKEIIAMRMQGKTLEEIGSTFNLTRERVRQIISKFGPDLNFSYVKELRKRGSVGTKQAKGLIA